MFLSVLVVCLLRTVGTVKLCLSHDEGLVGLRQDVLRFYGRLLPLALQGGPGLPDGEQGHHPRPPSGEPAPRASSIGPKSRYAFSALSISSLLPLVLPAGRIPAPRRNYVKGTRRGASAKGLIFPSPRCGRAGARDGGVPEPTAASLGSRGSPSGRSSENLPSETVRKVSDAPTTQPYGTPKSTFRPILAFVYRPNLRPKRCSEPFSDSLSETVWKLGWRGVNEARSASLRRENTLSLPLYVGL